MSSSSPPPSSSTWPATTTTTESATAAPWRTGVFPTELDCPALLYPDEVAYLHWVGAADVAARGRLIDLGAWVGGSSLALARGSARHTPPPPIDAYDVFEVTEAQCNARQVPGPVGSSYLDQYKLAVHAHLDRITTHVGYIPAWADTADACRAVDPAEAPVSVLFIDCAKVWGVHHTILRTFGPRLLEGAVVVQQDFRSWLLYLPAHMYQLRDLLPPAHFVDGGCVGFVAAGPLPLARIDALWTPDDLVERGFEATIDEITDWWRDRGDAPMAPWIRLAAAAHALEHDLVDELTPQLTHAIAEAPSLADGPDDERRRVRIENWNGEARRLVGALMERGLDRLAAQARVGLLLGDVRDVEEPHAAAGAALLERWAPVADACRAHGWRRVALFGAGRHTMRLLAAGWPDDPALEVAVILDDAAGKSGYRIGGTPIMTGDEAAASGRAIDVVIPSSDAHEATLLPRCAEVAGRLGAATLPVYTADAAPAS